MPKTLRRPRNRGPHLGVDPTRTATLRRAFSQKIARSFDRLRFDLYRLLVDDDALGLVADGQIQNVFCATGPGGGVDATCSPHGQKTILAGKLAKVIGTKEAPINCGADIKLAAKLLSQGHHVSLNQPEQVSTLLSKMDKMVQKAVKLGEKAPTFDLCKVSVKNTNLFCQDNLGIPRVRMPQMRGMPEPGSFADSKRKNKIGKVDVSADFIEHLKKQGIGVTTTDIRASHLRASQNEIVGARVAQLVREQKAGDRDLRERPIFVTRDNYVVDGHHHWAAIVGYGYGKNKDLKVPVHVLDMDIGKALDMANAFAKQVGIKPKAAQVQNVFCPTGEGGGIKATCRKGGTGPQAIAEAISEMGIINKLGAPGRWLKNQTAKMYVALEGRYGKKTAIAIMVSGQVLAWGATAAGAAAGVPVWLPGSSLWGAAPAAAIAETILQVHKGYKALTHNEEEPSQELIDKAARKLVAELMRLAKAAQGVLPQEQASAANQLTTNAPQAWRWLPDPEKVKAFQAWLRGEMGRRLRSRSEEELWQAYIEQGFRKGAGRAFDDVRRADPGRAERLDFFEGTRDQFLRQSFMQPVAVEKVKFLASRAFDELEGVDAEAAVKLTRALADGLVQGQSPHEIARAMTKQLDISRERAEMIAQTEIIRAHAEGQLQALENMGVEEVGVAVEWTVTKTKNGLPDKKVCPRCKPMDGVVLKLEEAHGMIPRHPRCRCAFMPANVGEEGKNQKDSAGAIRRAIKDSLGKSPDDWGPAIDISKDRPKSIFNEQVEEELRAFSRAINSFCPTGPGGGVDPSCSPGGGHASAGASAPVSLGDIDPQLALKRKRILTQKDLKQMKEISFHQAAATLIHKTKRDFRWTDAERNKWEAETRRNMKEFSGEALRQIVKNINKVQVRPLERIQEDFRGGMGGKVVAFYSPRRKLLAISEKHRLDNDPRCALAHEMAHALDKFAAKGLGKFSDKPDFLKIWNEEIKQNPPPISRYSTTNPQEGFAEALGFVHQHGQAHAARKIPRTVAYLRKKGILHESS